MRVETIGSKLKPMDGGIDFCFLEPRSDRLSVSQRFAQVGKSFQSSADHLVTAEQRKKSMPARMNQRIELAAVEHCRGGDYCFESLGLALTVP